MRRCRMRVAAISGSVTMIVAAIAVPHGNWKALPLVPLKESYMGSASRIVTTVCLGLLLASQAHAQANRPIRFVIPFPPGGLADYVARVIAPPLTQALGQQILIDNRPGGDGAVAGTIVMKAAPDGHTIFFGTNTPMSAMPA